MTRRLWQSPDHHADTPAFRRAIAREFPAVTDLCTGPERRQFLRLMAASLAMAGLAGCDETPDGRAEEVPYVNNPLRIEPGARVEYASMALQDGLANGITVLTRNARPLKVEGNPDHPWSRGGTDVFGQASVLDLWDPARSQTVRLNSRTSSWQAFRGPAVARWAELRAKGGAGLRILTGPNSSPTFLAQLDTLLQDLPEAGWHTHSATEPGAAGTNRAFGRPLDVTYQFDAARTVVALDADFLDPGPRQVAYAGAWAAARRASAGQGGLLALHAATAIPNLTAAKADHPLVATPAELIELATGLLADLEGAPGAGDGWRDQAARALHANRGRSLVATGATAPAALAELVHRLNDRLGNTGHTVRYTDPVRPAAGSLADLVADMGAGRVDTLLILDANPVYDAPGALDFAAALQSVPFRVHAGLYVDETALHCDWHLPLQHTLESWADARAPDGTVTLAQPTIAPLYDGKTLTEIVSLVTELEPRSARDLLEARWQDQAPQWEDRLRQGFIPGTALPPQPVRLVPAAPPAATPAPAGLSVIIRPDPTIWDGRLNNAWLQELPKPLTKLVWENVLTIGPALAAQEGLATGDVATLTVDGRAVEGPIWVLPGQAEGTIGATLGYGRQPLGLLTDGVGYNAAALQTGTARFFLAGATLAKTGRRATLATTQDHDTMEGHDFVRVQTEGAAPIAAPVLPSLYPPLPAAEGPQWGMVIDLDACIGCNACVVSCQSENNIAVVGKEQVALGREMHWLRVDRYYEGPPEAPQTRFQPVPCMHCENAPCEVGCPVEATLHDSQGLNLMVYNRCVGTRACSGYCPYKVRHFNYLDYSAGAAPSLQLQRNPEVTVRARGVMEKCTFCVQRIENARIEAHKADAPIPDGAVQTACQSACPTRAITFGDLADPASAVAKQKGDPRNYALLAELGTRPRTTYLAALAAKPDA